MMWNKTIKSHKLLSVIYTKIFILMTFKKMSSKSGLKIRNLASLHGMPNTGVYLSLQAAPFSLVLYSTQSTIKLMNCRIGISALKVLTCLTCNQQFLVKNGEIKKLHWDYVKLA